MSPPPIKRQRRNAIRPHSNEFTQLAEFGCLYNMQRMSTEESKSTEDQEGIGDTIFQCENPDKDNDDDDDDDSVDNGVDSVDSVEDDVDSGEDEDADDSEDEVVEAGDGNNDNDAIAKTESVEAGVVVALGEESVDV
jgi:hypothetical protein